MIIASLLCLLLGCLVQSATSQELTQQSYFWTGRFKFQTIRNDGVLTPSDIALWEAETSEFFAYLYQDLDLESPILGCGVVMQATNQTFYVVSTNNGGQARYGVIIDMEVVVTYQSYSLFHNVGFLALRIFDRDEQDNLIYFSTYLAKMRSISNTFVQINWMALDVSSATSISLQNPIPTLPNPNTPTAPVASPTLEPLVSTTEAPTQLPFPPPTTSPTKEPTPFPSPEPTQSPTSNPTKNPTTSPTKNPTTSPTEHPTLAPTTLSPTAPDETRAPTPMPVPTSSPTSFPTRVPTIPIYTYYATAELVLEDTNAALEGSTFTSWKTLTEQYLKDYVNSVLKTESLRDLDVEITQQERLSPRSRRSNRLLQTENIKPLYVEFNTILEVTANTFDAKSLIDTAFSSKGRRDNYLAVLQSSQEEFFSIIETITLPDGDPDDDNNSSINNIQTQIVPESGMSTGAIVGIAIGIGFLVLAVIGLIYQSRQSASSSLQNRKDTTGVMSSDDSPPRHGRLDAEIVVNKDNDDISTLGDPFFGNVQMEEQTVADKTVSSSSVHNSYDFFKLLGKSSLLGKPAGEDIAETQSRANTRTPGMEIAEDDASFEDMFGEMR